MLPTGLSGFAAHDSMVDRLCVGVDVIAHSVTRCQM
jgi:hypothetical protein